eukprot:6485354-Amphidinium_carterae.1
MTLQAHARRPNRSRGAFVWWAGISAATAPCHSSPNPEIKKSQQNDNLQHPQKQQGRHKCCLA